jgi:hypothetical protein
MTACRFIEARRIRGGRDEREKKEKNGPCVSHGQDIMSSDHENKGKKRTEVYRFAY